jgi:uncharacterized protein YjbI with pentapeptide repeats
MLPDGGIYRVAAGLFRPGTIVGRSAVAEASLTQADITGAHVMGADLTGTIFSSADLMKARGARPKPE